MTVLRSILFNVVFYVNLLVFLLVGSPLFLAPRTWAMAGLKLWARSSLWWLKVLCGTKMEVRGLQNLPTQAALIAGKHQSLWETFAILPLLPDPAMVLKRELTFIPLFGWFALKFRMIAVERAAGSTALRNLVKRGKQEIATGRQIVIMPEGTRKGPDDAPDYKPGAAALYAQLQVPCVPFGLNAGLFWPRRKLMRYPGTIVIEFLPAIPPGLGRAEFQHQLQQAIETSTQALVAEARRNHPLF
jgi:1-acyl-sn-glycerol-3-phosphate acyltransferase